MDNKDKNLPEASASTTLKATSPGGFEILLTSRDFEDKELTRKQLAHLLNLDKALIASGFTPVVRGAYGKPQPKPIEYIADRFCPADNAKLIKGTGKMLERCENYKWDFQTKKNVGSCNYIVWT